MRTAPKIALSLLISILLFSGLAAAAYAGLFNILETRFYQPAVIGSIEQQLGETAKAMTEWHAQNTEKFSQFVNADAVKRALLPNQSAQDIFDRSNLAGTLLSDMPGLTGIRIIDSGDSTVTADQDKGTRRIHFSTFKADILKKEDFQISYVNYGTLPDDVPFGIISVADGAPPKLLAEPGTEVFLYCFPFYDSYSSWRGTAVFYVSVRAAAQYLISQNLFRISDDLVLLSDSSYTVSGTVTGMPRAGRAILDQAILDRWKNKNFNTDRIVSTDDSGWVLLSKETGLYGFTGQLVQESLFTFPKSVKILFLAISFITLFLVIFLLFNLKQDEMMLIRNRIRRFQAQLINELLEKKDDVRWEEVKKNLTTRKHDISAEIKKGFGRHLNKKHGAQIDALLDKNWEEILAALGQQESRQAAIANTDELRLMLEQVLQNNAISLNLTGIAGTTGAGTAAAPGTGVKNGAPATDDIEGLAEEVEELTDEVEELSDDIEELPADDIEELAEEVEELSDEVEELPADEVEELSDQSEEPFIELNDGNTEGVDSFGVATPTAAQPAADSEQFISIDMGVYAESTIDIDYREEVEADEVEYLEGEWEPDLLEVASDEEMIEYIEDNVPDSVLVYNFDERPELDSGQRANLNLSDTEMLDSMVITRPDFSALDDIDTETEDATEVDYIDTFLFNQTTCLQDPYADSPAYEFLEVIGEADPAELLDLDDAPTPDDGAIVNQDGLYMVAAAAPGTAGTIDSAFQELVDSVLL